MTVTVNLLSTDRKVMGALKTGTIALSLFFIETYCDEVTQMLESFRITLCLNARSLLEQIIAKKDYPSYCEDLLAMSYFYLGCCDQKMNFLKSCKYGNEVLCSTEDKCKPKIFKHSEMDVS